MRHQTGPKFKEWRKARKVSRSELGGHVGVSERDIAGVEATEAVVPTEWQLAVLAIATERTVAE